MPDYPTPAGFRAAVEARLRERAHRLGVPAYVVRRQAAIERLLVRLSKVAPGRWAIKGGIGLETRLGGHARVSLDLDADHIRGAEAARADLQRAAVQDLGDHFAFALVATEPLVSGPDRLAIRYSLEATLSGRPFEPVQVDVTIAPPSSWDPQPGERPGLLREFGLGPVTLALVPLERQVAEKLHAYTRTYKGGGTTRARDVVDLLLIRQHGRVDPVVLRSAILKVFESRATHPVPESLAPPPQALEPAFRRDAASVGVVSELSEAHHLLAEWLDPVLGEVHRR
ncbi:MAG: nucleotidyl transferase AbiEii/AbiGii toxin family protein [Gemmatimonadales bacterium]|nr:nucleotidyl transferase AbiEii/AbiGii toxin family protein [Gemmatimonadales bacterium]